MDVTKSIYLGGELIYADNPHLNYSSCKDLGLCCVFCNAETHFRRGHVRIPHFAHYADIPSSVLEKCKLRQTSYSSLAKSSLRHSLTSEGKQQRLKIFQEHFLDIIASNDFNFYEKIQIIQNRKKLEPDIEKITKLCAEKIVSEKKLCFKFINKHFENIKDKEFPILKEKIVQEALDYLCILSSRTLLEQIIQYIIYQYEYNSEIKKDGYLSLGNKYQFDLINQFKLDEKWLYLGKNIKVILIGLLFILIITNWIEIIKPSELVQLLIEKDRKTELSLKQKNITKKRKKSKGYKHGSFIENIFYFFNLEINKPYALHKTDSKCFFLEFKNNERRQNNFQFHLIIKTGSKQRRWYLGCIKSIYKTTLNNRICIQWILFPDTGYLIDYNNEITYKDIADKVKCFLKARVKNYSEEIIIKSPIFMKYEDFLDMDYKDFIRRNYSTEFKYNR